MSIDVRPSPEPIALSNETIALDSVPVIRFQGDLDLLSRGELFASCIAGGSADVVLDMSEMTFVDCHGYGGLIAVSEVLRSRGGALEVRNQTGQPARLLVALRFGLADADE